MSSSVQTRGEHEFNHSLEVYIVFGLHVRTRLTEQPEESHEVRAEYTLPLTLLVLTHSQVHVHIR